MKTIYALSCLFIFNCILISSYAQPTNVTFSFNTTGEDALVISGATYQYTNFGSASNFGVYYNDTRRAYLRMDFSSIPTNAIITSAQLKMYAYGSYDAAVHPAYLSRLNTSASWTEGGVTWDNQPSSGTFITADQVSIPHSTTIGWYTVNNSTFVSHVQNMVNYPSNNKGWVLRLQSESGVARGVSWYSSEYGTTGQRPYIDVTYILPIEIDGDVTHCSEGNNDGTISNIVITEGTETYSTYQWYKYDMGTVTSIFGPSSSFGSISRTGLSDGLYLLRVTDNGGNIGYQYFLVGEENTSTTVEFSNSDNTNSVLFNDDALLTYTVSTANGDVTNGNSTSIRTYRSTSTYMYSLLKYRVNFDPALFYDEANLTLFAVTNGHTHTSGGSNETQVARVTAQWYENTVTWNTKPAINASTPPAEIIPETPVGTTTIFTSTIDFLDFVNYWSANPSENFGVRFDIDITDPGTQQMHYLSYDYATHVYRPKLVLTYSLVEPTNYFELTEIPQGSYYRVTDDLLRVKYIEEYLDQDGSLTYVIKNGNGEIEMDQTDESQLVTFGDNRLRIDVSSLASGYYTFEVTNEKNENWYLRFEVV